MTDSDHIIRDRCEPHRIGNIGNYYGGLFVMAESGQCYWGIENYDGTDWEEIPESLFCALTAFEDHRAKQEKEGE